MSPTEYKEVSYPGNTCETVNQHVVLLQLLVSQLIELIKMFRHIFRFHIHQMVGMMANMWL